MGLFSAPPPNGSTYPDIQPADFVTAGKQTAAGASQGGWIEKLVVAFYHGFVEAGQWIIIHLAGGFDDIFAIFLKFISAAQGTGQPGFVALMSGVLGDLLGLEIDEDELISALVKGGRLSSLRVAGEKLYEVLQSEFSPGGPKAGLGPSPVPAYGFLGFLIEFAIRQGNVATFCEFIPEQYNFFAGLREYGELLAKNLGLGRLARRALQPLVQTLVAEPLQWYLNQAYTPKLLAEAQYIKALHRGDLSRAEIDTRLSWLGYSQQAIEILIADTARPWQPHELLELQRLGQMDDATAISLMQIQGIDQGTATQWWTATKGGAEHPLVDRYAGLLLSQFENGFIDASTYQSQIDLLPLTDGEKRRWKDLMGQRAETGWRHLSEGELERAYLGGIIDVTTIQTAWQHLGYTPAAIQTLTFLLLQRQSASSRTKAGHVLHKHLSEAQLEKAYNGAIIDLAQLQAGWVSLGYSPADIEILTALVTAKTPGTGTTQFPGITVP